MIKAHPIFLMGKPGVQCFPPKVEVLVLEAKQAGKKTLNSDVLSKRCLCFLQRLRNAIGLYGVNVLGIDFEKYTYLSSTSGEYVWNATKKTDGKSTR